MMDQQSTRNELIGRVCWCELGSDQINNPNVGLYLAAFALQLRGVVTQQLLQSLDHLFSGRQLLQTHNQHLQLRVLEVQLLTAL